MNASCAKWRQPCQSRLCEYQLTAGILHHESEARGGSQSLAAFIVPARGESVLEVWPSVAEHFVFDELLYHAMTADDERREAFCSAVSKAAPGRVVVDIGTGADALFARRAVEAGAIDVYAIEKMSEVYETAKRRLEVTGLLSKITLLHGDARVVELPKQAEVCVFGLIGHIGGMEGVAAIIRDARRFLSDDAVMIPRKCVTRAAMVELPDGFLQSPVLSEMALHYLRRVVAEAGQRFELRLCLKGITSFNLITDDTIFEEIDFNETLESSCTRQSVLEVKRAGTISGLLLWLVLDVDDHHRIEILDGTNCWLPVYFPIFSEPVPVLRGDTVDLWITSSLSEDLVHPDYSVSGRLQRWGKPPLEFRYHSPYRSAGSQLSPFHQKVFEQLETPAHGGLGPRPIRRYLREYLPEYMLPSSVTLVDKIPQLPSGKIDRASLAIQRAGPQASETDVSPGPRNHAELGLCRIWSELLQVDRVGITDNFYDLGGHSLLAMRALSRISELFGVEVQLTDIFEAPTVAQLAARLKSAKARAREESIPASGTEAPLTAAQQRLWFLERWDPGTPCYNVVAGLRIHSDLDVAALEAALKLLISRHDALRTRFEERNGEALQVLVHESEFSLTQLDGSSHPELVREQMCERFAKEEACRPFSWNDDSFGPLFRSSLFRLAPNEWAIVVVMHHLICDGWSMHLFFNELGETYRALVTGSDSQLRPINLRHIDSVARQAEQIPRQAIVPMLEHWRSVLAGSSLLLRLPTDRLRPPVRSSRGGLVEFQIPVPVAKALKQWSREQGITTFVTLLGAFAEVLHRYSGQDDLLIGTPVSTRDSYDQWNLIGLAVNTIVVRVDLSRNPSFETLAGRVQAVLIDALSHRHLPFEQLVDDVVTVRDLSVPSLVQVMFQYDEGEKSVLAIPGLPTSPMSLHSATSKFDLTLSLHDEGEGIRGALEYSSDLYERSTIEQMAIHITMLLSELAARPLSLLSELRMLTASELTQQLVTFNESNLPYDQTATLHLKFESCARSTPNAVAVRLKGQPGSEVTFDELDRRANRLARRLVELGVRAESRVIILLDRSVDAVIAILATLKAGGAYIPLSPNEPSARLSKILADAHPAAVIIGRSLLQVIAQEGVTTICVGDELPEDDAPLPCGTTADNLAYVIYTSGSTGTPKGVMVTHRSAVNYLTWAVSAYPVNADRAVLLHTGLQFDLTVTSLFVPLWTHGTIVIQPEDFTSPPHDEDPFAFIKLTPTHLEMWRAAPLHTKTLVVGGEALRRESLPLHTSGQRIINEYGPTETTVACAAHVLSNDDKSGDVPVGFPIANARIYLLGPQMQLVPQGAIGEIYVGGDGLARGYLNSPALTARCFIPDPFSGIAGARLYRTGDLARLNRKHQLVFVGRRDEQIKIAGMRIEPGEVAAALHLHPGVGQSVVVAVNDGDGVTSLVAYITPGVTPPPSGRDLRNWLALRLPAPMIPAAFVPLDALPVGAGGKLDRKALPPVSGVSGAVDISFESSIQTDIGRQVARVWRDVLEMDEARADESFFEAGGNSFLAMRLASRLNKVFQTRITVREVFESPTIPSLTRIIEGQTKSVRNQVSLERVEGLSEAVSQ